ncbi:hypothetical protein [Microcoleus sp. PH2017_08_TRC_O_A]|nr:hypothetical protein [Microcoleus sp. PH2017_08_TRC_O_A]MCC3456339.1 hypothetical protein [Microcoleus sp. PH2017_08_TRC_O_A]
MAVSVDSDTHKKKEEGRRKKEEGRRKKEEGRRNKVFVGCVAIKTP